MKYFFIIDADLSQHSQIKQHIENLIAEPKLLINSIKSSRSFIDIQNCQAEEYTSITDDASWSCIALAQ